jgi:hypothetical protein
MQDRCDRQILAADWAVDNDLKTLHGGEDVNGAPIATRAIVINDQH